MPSKSFALKRGAPKILKVDWCNGWNYVNIIINGRKIASLTDKDTLRQGWVVEFSDGNSLLIKLRHYLGIPRLYLFYNGEPVPDSPADPLSQIKFSRWLLWILCFFNLLVGVNNIFSDIDFFSLLGKPAEFLIWGGLFGLLALNFQKRTPLVLMLASFFLITDAILEILLASATHQAVSFSIMVIRVALLLQLMKSFFISKKIHFP